MEADLAKYEAYRKTIRRLLISSGIWPHYEGTFRPYRIITLVSTFVIAALGAKVFAYCLDNISNVSLFAKGMSNAFSFYTSVLKVVCYLVYRKDLVMLNDSLGRKFDEDLKRIERRPLLLEGISVFCRFMYIVAGLTAAALIFYTLVPLIIIFKHKKYIQIYQGRYPFAIEPESWLYWFICFVESISIVFVWNVVCSVDNGFGLHIFRMCGLLRSLAERYRNLKPGDPDHLVELRDCASTHQLLLRCKEALQRIYGLVVIWTYVTSAIIMCSILYQADQAKKHMTVTKVIFFVSYIALKLLQSFTYAYYGSLVSQESEKCQNAIYASNWAGSGDIRLMKDILIIQLQRPIVLRANGFFIVSMEMFGKIVNTTISYFFLLQTVEEK